MVDKVRLSVDQETQALLESVTEGLRDLLSTQPDWAEKQHREVLRQIQSITTVKPSWTTSLQSDLQAAIRTDLDTALKLVRDLNAIQGNVDDRLRAVAEALARIEELLVSQEQAKAAILATLGTVSDTLKRQQTLLEHLARPWWKRMLGGSPQ